MLFIFLSEALIFSYYYLFFKVFSASCFVSKELIFFKGFFFLLGESFFSYGDGDAVNIFSFDAGTSSYLVTSSCLLTAYKTLDFRLPSADDF